MNSFRTRILLVTVLISCALKAQNKPNVIFIAVDDLNNYPSYTKAYQGAITPNMDKLAGQGIVFDKAFCQWPTCGPSRSSIMSGLLPTTIGGKEKMTDEKLQERAKELGTKLLHEYFADYGYKTLAGGKICHKHVPEGSVDESNGRGSFTAGLGRMGVNYKSEKTSTDWAAVEKPDNEFPDYELASWGVEKLEEKHEKPFFLMLGFLSPHVPWYVNKKWFDIYDKDKIELPPYLKNDFDDIPQFSKGANIQTHMPSTEWAIKNNQWRNILHAYLASISFTDAQLGRVLKALDKSEYRDNTIVVLWSDHGYHMGEKNTFQKHSLWERAGKVPMIISAPFLNKGKRVNKQVGLLDMYPTLLELCGLPKNNKNEGRSLVPLLKDVDREWPYSVTTSWRGGNFAIQNDRYRYLIYTNGEEELYDHKNDPNEWNNIAENPEMMSLKKEMKMSVDLKKLENTLIKGK